MTLELRAEILTGNPAIDQQHERIFRLLSELAEAVGQGKGQLEIGRILASVSVFVIGHFRMEEALMTAAQDPHLAGHRQDHERLGQKVESLVDRFHQGRLFPEDFLDFMSAWLDKHVVQHDLPMARFLNGPSRPACGPVRRLRRLKAGRIPIQKRRRGTTDRSTYLQHLELVN